MKVLKCLEDRDRQAPVEHWEFTDANSVITTCSYVREPFDSSRFTGIVLYEDFEGSNRTAYTATLKWSSAWFASEQAEPGNVTAMFESLLDGYLFDLGWVPPILVTREVYPGLFTDNFIERIMILKAQGKPNLALGMFKQNSEAAYEFNPRILRFTLWGNLGRYYV